MADNFDNWRPKSKEGKAYKILQEGMEKTLNDPKMRINKNNTLSNIFSLVRLGFELFGDKK